MEVDGLSLQGYSNQQAVEMLRSTGRVVNLRLVRYVHGLKFEQLQQAIASSNAATPSEAVVVAPSAGPGQAVQTSPVRQPLSPPRPPQRTDSLLAEEATPPQPEPEPEQEEAGTGEAELVAHWSEVLGPEFQVVVADISKFKEGGGLGISLEGTVEKVDGAEQNPHHYIRSVLPNGPVGQNGRLQSGDELLEVNGQKLLGLYHSDVVGILKELPVNVRLVCARPASRKEEPTVTVASPVLPSPASQDRLVKAKSDGSIR